MPQSTSRLLVHILIERDDKSPTHTGGRLSIDGTWECFTLEDVVRAPGVKVPGQTAIPAGKYKIIIDDSPRFGRPLPHVLDVPDFTGVRIHPGNKVEDTEGCILVGQVRNGPTIERSRVAFNFLFDKLLAARANGSTVILEIV